MGKGLPSYEPAGMTQVLPGQTHVRPYLNASIKLSKTVLSNSNVSQHPKLCLVFSGQGPQHIFMGRQLTEIYPEFLDSIRGE